MTGRFGTGKSTLDLCILGVLLSQLCICVFGQLLVTDSPGLGKSALYLCIWMIVSD